MRSLLWALMGLTAVNALSVSKNAHCGKAVGLTCKGSAFGNCCSKYNYCGSTSAYCGAGCQSKYGSCGTSPKPPRASSTSTRRTTQAASRTSSVAAPSSTGKVSTNARCGYLHGASPGGMTCRGSKWGDCCSQYSYCGSTEDYCGNGCQLGFGKCNNLPQSSSSSSKPSSSTTVLVSSSSSTTVMVSTSTTTAAETVSTASSQDPSTTSASSTTEPSSVTPTSTTSNCLATSTNAVTDGSFECGTLNTGSGWSTISSGDWDITGEVYESPGSQDGTHLFDAVTHSARRATTSLINRNVLVPSGTTVLCQALVSTMRNSMSGQGSTTFQILIDGTPCTGVVNLFGDVEWKQYGSTVQVNGDSHEVRIDIVSDGENESGAVIYIDKVEVIPVGGPAAVPT